MTLYSTIKTLVERGIVFSGATLISRRRHRDDILILAYHNIVPTGEMVVGDASLHLPQHTFAQQLDVLQRTCDIVPLGDVVERTQFAARSTNHAKRSKPLAVITFDDAYRGALTAGIHELRQRDLPATMFVAPAYLGGKSFWWDVLTPLNAKGLTDEFREHALTTDAGKGVKILDRARNTSANTITQMPLHAQCALESELVTALSFNKLTLGSHTWSHPNLTQLSANELQYEMRAPKAWLLERFNDRTVSAISYPYGRSNQTVWDAAQSAGYDIGLLIDGGWAQSATTAPYAIPRLNIPSGVSVDGFVLRTSGLISR